jgi:hypothetical protein
MFLRRGGTVLVGIVLAGCGSQSQHPDLMVGAVEDTAKFGDAGAQMRLASDSGFRAIALSSVWTRGLREPAPAELAALRSATRAATENHIRPLVAVYSFSANTPVHAVDRRDFAAYTAALLRDLPGVRDVIVGNEPNLNLFWLPQYDANGGDAAAVAFEDLLATTYDAVKNARPDVQVIGAGLSPRGSDDPAAPRATHSPTQFLLDLGAAYRASRRDRPIMDAFAIHPYGENARIPPSLAHPRTKTIGIADYGKLVALLGEAFDGTAQRGIDLPVVYGEYGVETTIPVAKQSLYSGSEVIPTADEATQAQFYGEAIRFAACQPTVELLLFFHVVDESRLAGLQTGTRYADGSPKSSLDPVRRAVRATANCAS